MYQWATCTKTRVTTKIRGTTAQLLQSSDADKGVAVQEQRAPPCSQPNLEGIGVVVETSNTAREPNTRLAELYIVADKKPFSDTKPQQARQLLLVLANMPTLRGLRERAKLLAKQETRVAILNACMRMCTTGSQPT